MRQLSRINFVIILLVELICVLMIQAFPDTLTVKIENGHEIIMLNWKKTDRSVANSNLPVWIVERLKTPQLLPDIMYNIGPFAFYHDIEKSSAVVLFSNQNRIYGVIDTRFWISALPLSEVGPGKQHTVGGRFIQRRSRDEEFHDEVFDFPEITNIDVAYINSFLDDWLASEPTATYGSLPDLNIPNRPARPSSSSLPHIDVRDMYSTTDARTGPPNEHQVVETAEQVGDPAHAEILVMISNNVIRHFTKNDPKKDLGVAVICVLAHFNAIDMLFAKLPNDIKININIAGLVLESQIMVFPYAFMPTNERPLRILDGRKTLEQIPKYLHRYRNVFPRDSYDFFYLATRYRIHDKEDDSSRENSGEPNAVACDGLSRTPDMYENRKRSNAKFDVPGSIIERKAIYGDYVTSAHEIAHLMHVDHDPVTEGVLCQGVQCYAILQEYGSYCKNCIKWSDQSIEEFRAFVSTNYDHCFLLNPPRSLHPYGTLMMTLGPRKQCTCYEFESHQTVAPQSDQVSPDHCDKKLACTVDDRPTRFAVPKPIDGTPCGPDKVCWQKECHPLQFSPMVQLLDL